MDGMTEYQYRSVLKMLRMIISDCKTIEEAQQKINSLLDSESEEE